MVFADVHVLGRQYLEEEHPRTGHSAGGLSLSSAILYYSEPKDC